MGALMVDNDHHDLSHLSSRKARDRFLGDLRQCAPDAAKRVIIGDGSRRGRRDISSQEKDSAKE